MSQQVSPATVVVVLVLLLAILVGLYFLVVSTRQAAPEVGGLSGVVPRGAGQQPSAEPSAEPPPAASPGGEAPAAGPAAKLLAPAAPAAQRASSLPG